MMSDTNFSDMAPEKDDNFIRETDSNAGQKAAVGTNAEENLISSKEYEDIRPFYASQYGWCRLFTAQYNGKKVIIKTLKAAFAKDNVRRAALCQEYEATIQLENKYIRRAIDFVTIKGLGDCIIFEYVDGVTLAEHVRVGTITEKQIKSVLLEICDALQHMHQRGVYHCNLMPENILVTSGDMRAKIIDIGMAEMDFSKDRDLMVKEMEFNAPEVIKGEDPDGRSDVFSLGKIMEFIGERNISRKFDSVATHATQFSREQRFDTISELRSAITKGHSVLKIFLVLIVLGALGALAYVYVPKFKAKADQEKEERMRVEFRYEADKIQAETPSLCEKFRLTSLSEPVGVSWTDDSLRYCQQLSPFMANESLRAEAEAILNGQRNAIVSSRQRDFDRLLISTFRNAQDSLALQMKIDMGEFDDTAALVVARQWHDLAKQNEAGTK